MGRWSQYDEDDYRLPEGMQRVGYDADTQTYTYQARDGSSWEGAPGAKYGALRQVGAASEPSRASRAEELEQLPEAASATNNKETDIPSPTEKHHEKPGEDILSEYASMGSAKQKDWSLFAPFLFLRRTLTQSRSISRTLTRRRRTRAGSTRAYIQFGTGTPARPSRRETI